MIWWAAVIVTVLVYSVIHPFAGIAFVVGMMAMDVRHSNKEIDRLRK